MKYFLIGCLFLQVACSSSPKQVTSNAQQSNAQQAQAEPNPLTEVPLQPEVPVDSAKRNPDNVSRLESHYITMSGIRNVQITDGQGNDNGPVSTAYRKKVPGVSESVIGPESMQIITPTDNTYTIRFTGNGKPMAIEDIRGVTNEFSDAAYIVRYGDLAIPDGRVAELKIVNDQVDSLKILS